MMVIKSKSDLKRRERAKKNRLKTTKEIETDDGKNESIFGCIKKKKDKEFDKKWKR